MSRFEVWVKAQDGPAMRFEGDDEEAIETSAMEAVKLGEVSDVAIVENMPDGEKRTLHKWLQCQNREGAANEKAKEGLLV